jgi:hypothetical protein
MSTKIPKMRRFILQNFPFIEQDFDALTDYELICKVVEYLNKVIEQTNLNSEQFEILTNAFNELKDYVDHYFDNLDVQDEINNKLEAMAESGQLSEIISLYLQLACVQVYDTLSDMQNATNLVDGSIARTFGKVTYNDGRGELYKIRTITSGDVVDGDNIVSVNFSNTLIGEKQKKAGREVIMIGDSYLAGQSLPSPETQNFGYLLMQKFGMNSSNFHIYGEGGSSFVNAGNAGHTWQTLLQSKVSDITDVNNVTDIWFFGGYNDVTAASGAQIENAMSNCISYAKSTFPNAEIRIALIGNNASDLPEQVANRDLLKNRVYEVYMHCGKYGAICVPKGQLPLQDYRLFEDNATAVHPNVQGHQDLADWLYQLIKSGDSTFYKTDSAYLVNVDASVGTPNNLVMTEEIRDNSVYLALYGELTLTNPLTSSFGDVNFGVQSDIHFLKYVNANPAKNFSQECVIRGFTDIANNIEVPIEATFRINPSGQLVLQYHISNISTSVKKIVFNWNWFKFNIQGC